MYWVPDEDHPPFGRIEVDPVLCIGCKKCTSKGPDGAFLDGCPWDAIEMVAIEEVERHDRHEDAGRDRAPWLWKFSSGNAKASPSSI